MAIIENWRVTNCTERIAKPPFKFYSISMENGENRLNFQEGDVNGTDTEALNYLNV